MLKTLYELFKALLNATLILLAICLFLGWKLLATLEGATENLGAISTGITSLGGEAQNLRADLSATRSTLADLHENGAAASLAPETSASLNRLSNSLNALEERIDNLADMPQVALSAAAKAGASQFASDITETAGEVLGCRPRSETLSLLLPNK